MNVVNIESSQPQHFPAVSTSSYPEDAQIVAFSKRDWEVKKL